MLSAGAGRREPRSKNYSPLNIPLIDTQRLGGNAGFPIRVSVLVALGRKDHK